MGDNMDSTIIAAIIGLLGVIFTSLFGIYMHKLGSKSDKNNVVIQKKIEIYSDLADKLQSLQKSINMFITLRLRNAMIKFLNQEDLMSHIVIYDNLVSEYYGYYKENCGKIILFCPNGVFEKLEKLHGELVLCRDNYQMLLEGDFYGRTKEEYETEWMKAVYGTDVKLRGEILKNIESYINEIISELSKDLMKK